MTVTNRAAKEMKSRLKSELGPVANQIQDRIFHSFCLTVMRKIPKSFGVSGFNIIDSDDQLSLMTLVRKSYLNKREKEINKEFPQPSDLVKYY